MRSPRCINFDLARAAGGRFLLRIEDIDAARCRPEYEQAIYDDLAWLGITWEQPVRRQSAHFDDYRAALARLDAIGLVYPSFESRGEIARLVAERETHAPWPRDPDGAPLYPGDARSLSPAERRRRMEAGEPYALRLDMAAAIARTGALTWSEDRRRTAKPDSVTAAPQMWGDVVLARKEMPTSYHLAVVVDDARQGVTHVVRGQDLFWSTSVHRAAAGAARPAGTDLPPPPPDPRCRRAKAIQIDARDRPCARCGRVVLLPPTSAGWSGLA